MKTIRSILVATDLGETSDEVLRAAAALASLSGARLHVLHAFDFQPLPYAGKGLERADFPERVEEARRALDAQIRRTVPPQVEVDGREVEIYVAHRAILDRAEAVDADLIVIGPHRRRARGDAFLGSTADRVIRSASAPCLVVRGPLSLPLRRVVVPIDLSKPARGALDAALEWSDALRPREDELAAGPRVTVLHVVPEEYDVPDFPFDREVIGPELHREVEAALGRLDGAGALDVREEVSWGNAAAEAIVEVAAREGADLLVLATHGHGAVRRALVGSVASAVARAADRPVLLVPPALWDARTE